MKKVFLKFLIIELLYLLLASLFLTMGLYFNFLTNDVFNIIIEILFFLNAFLISFFFGTKFGKKGLLIGLICFLCFAGIIITTNLIWKEQFNIKFYLRLAILLVISLFASVVGVNICKKN